MKNSPPQFRSIFSTRTKMTTQTKKTLEKLIQALFLTPLSLEFRLPLEWEKLGLFDYCQHIKKPMDLSKVKQNLKNQLYRYVESCLDDIELIFQNSIHYNEGNQWIIDLTDKCEKYFQKLQRNYFPDIQVKFHEQKKLIKKNKVLLKSKHQIEKQLTSQSEISSVTQDPNHLKEEKTSPKNVKDNIEKKKASYTQTSQPKEVSKECKQLFTLVSEASQMSLQIMYMVVKAQNVKAISTEDNGNCSLDIQMLDKEVINNLIMLLKQEKQSKINKGLKDKQNTKKIKKIHTKSRFEI